ncbi:unnamed protein product [Acanthosepion pharaonis]|uniref:Uncharacterized protein n=1 Tax=Acanthosepion pharaonis TaxID=158019 RepID=A0A812D9I5_ACAPH|nr:unnamed protein product [Sepia pharaonis]
MTQLIPLLFHQFSSRYYPLFFKRPSPAVQPPSLHSPSTISVSVLGGTTRLASLLTPASRNGLNSHPLATFQRLHLVDTAMMTATTTAMLQTTMASHRPVRQSRPETRLHNARPLSLASYVLFFFASTDIFISLPFSLRTPAFIHHSLFPTFLTLYPHLRFSFSLSLLSPAFHFIKPIIIIIITIAITSSHLLSLSPCFSSHFLQYTYPFLYILTPSLFKNYKGFSHILP